MTMSANPPLNDEQWTQLLKYAADSFNEVTLSRGFQYFKQQYVTSLNIAENRAIQAKVTGHEDYKVTLLLEKLGSSYCTCPVHTCCKHQAAVMMELADRLGYPANQIVNAKQHLLRAAATPLAESLLKELPGMNVHGWYEFMNQATSLVIPGYDQGRYIATLREQLSNLMKGPTPLTGMDLIYFELHQLLFILRKVFELNAPGGSVHNFSHATYRLYDEVHDLLHQKAALFDFTLSEERLKQTLSCFRQQMAEENKYLEYGLYTAIWKYWIAPQPAADYWASQELDAIERQTANSDSPSLAAAKAFLYLHQGKSSEAWAALEASGTLAKAPASLLLPFLNLLSMSGEWRSLVDWLMRTASHFYGPMTKERLAYMEYWKEAVEHVPEAEDLLWNVLEGILPHSIKVIEDMLYERHNWKAWIEMQILQERDPFHHKVSVLQPIEKEAPELLLPYYHQAIEHYVALKNRREYKAAVKLLKRLAKVYKKMKQVERWDRFFARFMERNSRLRALHEELKKGKLLE
ncbi:SWIM zinc finger domain-containing protein [Paenibacillus hodogayensis]|uniref:SWIM zinc finger domain-containing protein n=1 Tax=Paenibacillus hodogayensis TaxID=279208 RepID=A0ABV5W1K2_9BACL